MIDEKLGLLRYSGEEALFRRMLGEAFAGFT